MVFIDGLGIGSNNPVVNPCARENIRLLSNSQEKFSEHIEPQNGRVFSVDAALGVRGLPQSATGQASLLTGVNCAKRIGRHLPGFPNEKIRSVMKEKSLFKKIKDSGLKAAFINAFRPLFFRLPMSIRWRLSTTTIAALAAELSFFRIEDITEKRSLYHDFTNKHLVQKGFQLPVFTPEDAAQILAKSSKEFDFILYEYFLTDHAGHAQKSERSYAEILKLDQLIAALLVKIDLEETWLIVTSDHGNIENLTTKTHTRNPAMTIIWNNQIKHLNMPIKSLTDIAPFVMRILQNKIVDTNS